MLAFESLIVGAAEKAKMKVPPTEQIDKQWDTSEYPHFKVFCTIQLGRAMSNFTQHWTNAKLIAEIPDDRIRLITLEDLEALGVELA